MAMKDTCKLQVSEFVMEETLVRVLVIKHAKHAFTCIFPSIIELNAKLI